MDDRPSSAKSGSAAQALLLGKSVRIGLKQDVSLADIHKALEEILRIRGCLACGFNGFDLILSGVLDPAVRQLGDLNKLNGVRFAEIRPRLGEF